MPKRGQKVITEQRRERALQMRKAGLTYQQIGDSIGISKQAAHKLVRAALESIQTNCAETAKEIHTLETQRLDRLQAAIWAAAVKGDVGAIDRILRIMARRAKLLGLDTPDRHEVTVSDMSPDEIARSLLLGSGKG